MCLRQGPGGPNVFQSKRFRVGSFLRPLPGLNNPWNRATARHGAAIFAPESRSFGQKRLLFRNINKVPELDFREPRPYVDAAVVSGSRAEPLLRGANSFSITGSPMSLIRAGSWGDRCNCCATRQTFCSNASVFWCPALSWSAICGGIPHFAALASTYLIILISASPKLTISLQASSGGALRSLAALISLPRFSASSRSGAKSFMQASDGPEADGGAPRPLPYSGAAPPCGNGEALAGGGADLSVSGAGNAPCAPACPA